MSPRCVQEPENIANGYYVGTKGSYNQGDQLHYVCSQHYVMIGNPTVTCSSGSWIGGHPTCRLSFLSNGMCSENIQNQMIRLHFKIVKS